MRARPNITAGVATAVALAVAVVTSSSALAAGSSRPAAAKKHPVAALSLSTTKPVVGKKLTVNVSHSRLPKGDRLRKANVRFGDGSKVVKLHNLKTRAHHAYSKAGTFKVVLTIVDKHGVKVTKSAKVAVHKAKSSSTSPTSPTSPNPPASGSGLPIALPSGLLPTDLISSLGLSSTALDSVSSLLDIPSGTLTDLPVGFLALLPTGDLTGGSLPSLPGLASLPLVGNLVGMLLAGLPITIPDGIASTTLISALPSGVLSVLQLATLSTFFGIATSTLDSLPVNVLTLLPTGLVSGL